MRKYKTTFNNLLTHCVIPQLIFSDLDTFYESILPYPENLQQFMQLAVKHAAKQSMDDPDIEPPYTIETFDIGLEGNIEHGVIWIRIPNCKKMLDCTTIAFPSARENAGYFTCEYSIDPINNNPYYVIGEWKIDNDSFEHLNWGRSVTKYGEDFVERVHEIAYPIVDAEEYFVVGKEYFDAGNYDEAIVNFDNAIELKPDMVPYLFRGMAYNHIGNYTQAIADFDKAIQLDVDELSAYYFRGIAYYNIGNYTQAIADFDKAIKLNPDFTEAYNQRKLAADKLQKKQSDI
jgi:hypothetical protein